MSFRLYDGMRIVVWTCNCITKTPVIKVRDVYTWLDAHTVLTIIGVDEVEEQQRHEGGSQNPAKRWVSSLHLYAT